MQEAEKARKHCEIASKLGSQPGAFYLAKLKSASGENEQAFSEMKALAEEGYLPAAYRLSLLYRHGKGCDQNEELAGHYEEYAASHGHVWAVRNFAVRLMRGRQGLLKIPRGAGMLLNVLWVAFSMYRRDDYDSRGIY